MLHDDARNEQAYSQDVSVSRVKGTGRAMRDSPIVTKIKKIETTYTMRLPGQNTHPRQSTTKSPSMT